MLSNEVCNVFYKKVPFGYSILNRSMPPAMSSHVDADNINDLKETLIKNGWPKSLNLIEQLGVYYI